jgi:hypothetical protein
MQPRLAPYYRGTMSKALWGNLSLTPWIRRHSRHQCLVQAQYLSLIQKTQGLDTGTPNSILPLHQIHHHLLYRQSLPRFPLQPFQAHLHARTSQTLGIHIQHHHSTRMPSLSRLRSHFPHLQREV